MKINTEAKQTIKTLGLFVLWVVLMTLAGWYGRGQEPLQYSNVSAECPVGKMQARSIGR
jgi:hypothetical protein